MGLQHRLHLAGPTHAAFSIIDDSQPEQGLEHFHAERVQRAPAALGGPHPRQATVRDQHPDHVVEGDALARPGDGKSKQTKEGQ